MKYINLTSTSLPARLKCPTSKSYAARALIYAALSENDIQLSNMPTAQDTLDLMRVLKQLGIELDSQFKVSGSFPKSEISIKDTELNLGEGGTTIRFLLPLLALGKKEYHLSFEGRMQERPMSEFYLTLRELGVKIEETPSGIKIQGPLNNFNDVDLDCSRSSQFASALELVNHFYPNKVHYKNLSLSKTYFEMTKHVLEKISTNNSFEIPADFSCAGYFMSYAMFDRDLEITNINGPDLFQADSILLSLLKEIGVQISFGKNKGLIVEKISKPLCGIEVDGSKCIDLVPTLCFIAAHISNKSIIKNIKGLIHKESDRLKETLKILEHFSVEYDYDDHLDKLTVFGKSLNNYNFCGKPYDPPIDHRMVMVASLFIKLRGGGRISNAHAVKKSFPEFFTFFK